MCTRPPELWVPPAGVSCEGSALPSLWKPERKRSAPAWTSPRQGAGLCLRNASGAIRSHPYVCMLGASVGEEPAGLSLSLLPPGEMSFPGEG